MLKVTKAFEVVCPKGLRRGGGGCYGRHEERVRRLDVRCTVARWTRAQRMLLRRDHDAFG